MFYAYPYLASHPATHLNQQITEFFTNLSKVDEHTPFRLTTALFPQILLDRLNHPRADALRKLFESFFNAFKNLTPLERLAVLDQFLATQEVELWLDDITRQEYEINNDNLPIALRKPAKDLFLYLYEKTIKQDLRSHYRQLFKQVKPKCCPFCGIEPLPKPDTRKADYDHWLYKASYPFAAVNMRNLIPMGQCCNQDYKRSQNLLVDNFGARRQFYYPYTQSYILRLNLTGSILPKADTKSASWVINFNINNNIIQNWIEVFGIRKRYADELDKEFIHWTGVFVDEYKDRVSNIDTLKWAFKNHAATFEKFVHHQSILIKHGLLLFLAECDDNAYYNAVLKQMKTK